MYLESGVGLCNVCWSNSTDDTRLCITTQRGLKDSSELGVSKWDVGTAAGERERGREVCVHMYEVLSVTLHNTCRD